MCSARVDRLSMGSMATQVVLLFATVMPLGKSSCTLYSFVGPVFLKVQLYQTIAANDILSTIMAELIQ